jgi:signal transduction histidine kinase
VAQAFNEMARQVESMLEEQRAFASNTSHELRTPLTTIRLRSEALLVQGHLMKSNGIECNGSVQNLYRGPDFSCL